MRGCATESDLSSVITKKCCEINLPTQKPNQLHDFKQQYYMKKKSAPISVSDFVASI